ncbi:MAG: hypothetical protein KC656_14535 [Myxococcales bacterium]|nr:hypothetical protein [Myxococcales bacterium]
MWWMTAALAGSVDLGVGYTAVREAARYTSGPSASVRLVLGDDTKSHAWLAEARLRTHTLGTDAYLHRSRSVRLAVGHGWHTTTSGVRSDLWVGPAVEIRSADIEGRSALRVFPAFRAATGVTFPFGEHVGLRFQSGVALNVVRGTRTDFDLLLGPEARW